MRRRAGIALVVCGSLLTAYAASVYAAGAMRRGQVRRQWEEARARREVVAARASVGDPATASAVPGAPVARIVIPRIALDEIVVEGVRNADLNAGPGHLPGSALPGDRGNAVISAHRDRHFDRLGEVSVGDTIATETLLGWRRWVVVSRKVVDRDSPALFQTPAATLTLTTCWPIRALGPAPERLILTARPMDSPIVVAVGAPQRG